MHRVSAQYRNRVSVGRPPSRTASASPTVKMMRVLLAATCAAVLVGFSQSQSDGYDDCFIPGECLQSVYLDDYPTTDIDECLDLCQAEDFCQYWTLYLDEGLCFAFADCFDYGTDCGGEECYSGDRDCDDLPCNAPGKCEGGRTIDQTVMPSPDDCLKFCQDDPECLWYTYDPGDDACVLLDACPDVFTDDCDGCVFGHRLCEEATPTTGFSKCATAFSTCPAPWRSRDYIKHINRTLRKWHHHHHDHDHDHRDHDGAIHDGHHPLLREVFMYALARDATTNDLLEGVAVTLEGDTDTYSGTTDSDGVVELGILPAGTQATLFATLDGYEDFSRTYTVPEGVGDESYINFFMSPEILEGEFRGVMSWGSEPQDLDFHDLIFTQLGVVECEVYYSNKECGNVNLDIDNTNGGDNGPETITWTAPDTYIHLVYVYDYSGSDTSLYESGAHVDFYGPDGSTIPVDVPTDDTQGQRYWYVACIDGSVGYSSINVLNYLSFEAPDTVCEL